MAQLQSVTVDDFSGGITDLYLKCPLNRAKTISNLFLDADKKLIVRPGSTFYNATYSQIPATDKSITGLINHDNYVSLLVNSGKKIYWISGATVATGATTAESPFVGSVGWNTLTGPSSNDVLGYGNNDTGSGGTLSKIASGSWKGHTFLTNDAGTSVMKIYKDQNDYLRVRNAGLPALAATPSYDDLSTAYTDLASTSGTTNPSILTSVIRPFVAADIGRTVRIDSGTNWTVGFYTIASVTAGAATLASAVGTNATLSGGTGTLLGINTYQAVALANAIKTAMVAHFADTTYYHQSPAPSTSSLSATATSSSTLYTLTKQLLDLFAAHQKDSLSPSTLYHYYAVNNETVSNPVLTGAQITPIQGDLRLPTTLVECAERLNSLKTKWNMHDGDVDTHKTTLMGGPNNAISITDAASADGTTNPASVSSASRPFTLNDTGRVITVVSGANWTAGTYTIVSVSSTNYATLNSAVGTALTLSSGVITANAISNQVTVDEVSELFDGPYVTRDLTTIYNAANKLKTQLNLHINSVGTVFTGDISTSSNTTWITNLTPEPLLQIMGTSRNFISNLGKGYVFNTDTSAISTLPRIVDVDFAAPYGIQIGSNSSGTPIINTLETATGATFYTTAFLDGETTLPLHHKATQTVTAANATTPATLVALVDNIRFALASHIFTSLFGLNYWHVRELITPVVYTDSIEDHFFYQVGWGFPTLQPDGDQTSVRDKYGGAVELNLDAIIAVLEEAMSKFNTHDANSNIHGLAAEYRNNFIFNPPDLDFSSYSYALCYKYSYTVKTSTGTLDFEQRGPVTYVSADKVPSIASTNISIAGIPALANGSTENYDTSAIVVEVYRTKSGGSTYYYVGEVTNGTTTFTDTTQDTELESRATLYTTGGRVENDPPPVCKYMHVVNNKAYYANIVDAGEGLGARIRESLVDSPDSAPANHYVDIDQDVTGISSYRGRVISFSSKGVYRLEGGIDELGRGNLSFEKIYSEDGCISHQSIVQILEGVVWAGYNGFYYTDGYKVTKLNEGWVDTYTANVSSVTHGTYDSKDRRVWWTYKTPISLYGNICYVLDTRWGLNPYSCFSTVENGTNFSASAILFHTNTNSSNVGVIIRGDGLGYLQRHLSSEKADARWESGVATSSWFKKTIIYNYISSATDFGNSGVRKWVPWLNFTLKNETDQSIQIKSINDDGLVTKSFKPYRARSITGLMEEAARFPAYNAAETTSGLRCMLKQVQFTNGYVVVFNSDSYSTCTRSSATQMTIDSGSWPTDPVDMYIYFDADNYTTGYLISNRSTSTLTMATHGQAAGSGKKWVIKGYPKDERFRLVSYTMKYLLRSETSHTYGASSSETGANA